MRRAAILALLLPLAAAAPASAQRLPSTDTPGVTAKRGAGGSLTIRFAATRAGRDAYARYAGRRVTVRCQHAGPEPVGAGALNVVTAPVRFPAQRSSVRLTARGSTNLCSLGSFPTGDMVATDATARAFLSDLLDAERLALAAALVSELGPSATLRRVPRAVRLRSADATLPRGRIGVFKGGGTTAVATIGHDGRRLFFKETNGVQRTNLLGITEQLLPPVPAVTLPTGPLGGVVTALPATSDPSITAARDGDLVVFHFTGAARRGLAGARVSFVCVVASQFASNTRFAATFLQRIGPRSGPMRVTLATGFNLCTLSYAGRIAGVALDGAARPVLEDGVVSAAIDRVLQSAGAAALGGGYPSGTLLSERFGGAVVALAAPTDAPPDRRVGVWSDGARHLVVRAVSRTGHSFFTEVDGDVVTTNVTDILRPLARFG